MATQREAKPFLLGPGDDGRELTDEEFASAEFEEPWRYELVEGRLSVMSPSGQSHLDGTEPWFERLVEYKLRNRSRIDHVVPEAWVRIRQGQQRIGDIGVYLKGERSGTKVPDRVPELIFEVVSPGLDAHQRDYVEKRADYFEAGVVEYVIIDPKREKVTVLSQGKNEYRERVLEPEETYESPLLPGMEVKLAEVL